MRCVRICLLIAQAALLAGCNIYWKEPLGEAQALDPKDWDGIWLVTAPYATQFLEARVVDSKRGVLGYKRVCVDDSVEHYVQIKAAPRPIGASNQPWQLPLDGSRDAKGEFVVAEGDTHIEPSGEPVFAYPFFALRAGPVWTWYQLDENRVKRLVEQGALPGRVEQGRVIVGHLEPQHYDILSSVEHPVVQWEIGAPWLRLPPGIDPCKKQEPTK